MLDGKAAIVTGAGSGIGRASACALAAAGAMVTVADISEASAAQTVELIRASGATAQICSGDVTSADYADRLVQFTLDVFGRLDLAHNNAGVESPYAPITDAQEEDFDRSVAVNLKGVWLCMRAQLRHMVGQRCGAIVNTASVGGLLAVPGNSAYSAAKHGVIGLSKTAAVEYAGHGIRVNALCPGLTRSGMTQRLFSAVPELEQRLLPPMGRIADAAEIAGTVVFLLSDQASYLSGQAIAVDGAATSI